LVETAEERHRKQVVDAMRLADSLESSSSSSVEAVVSYVLVPSDTSKPLEECQFQPRANVPGDQLLEHLKPAFGKKSDETVDTELLRTAGGQQTLAGSVATPSVSDATLQQVAAEAHVESFTLVHPLPSNNFTGVNIYLDEVGMLKRLPLNKRASDWAARAGFNPAPQFYGDVYLGRIQQKPALRNRSFSLGPDTAPDADWLQAATTQNLEYQMEMNRITGRSGAQQPAVAGTEGIAQQEQDGLYSWTQTEEELEVVVPLSDAAWTSKDVAVQFRPLQLQVSLRKEPTSPIVSVPLFERVDVDACTWTLESDGGGKKKRLVITMEKLEPAFWPRIRD